MLSVKRARVNILPLSYHYLHASRQYREMHGLLTNGSLIVAVMRRERITFLATLEHLVQAQKTGELQRNLGRERKALDGDEQHIER